MKQNEMSEATKKRLAAALKRLMAHKPLTKITVNELVMECGMNRNSFYYHFEDIYALFKWMLEKEAVAVVKQYDLMMDYHEVINFVLDYVEQNQFLLTNAFHHIGQEGLKRFLYMDFISCIRNLIDNGESRLQVSLSEDYKQFLCEFYSEALAGILLEYLKNTHRRSREQVLVYTERVLRSTLPVALRCANE